jgi:hypothetical protein
MFENMDNYHDYVSDIEETIKNAMNEVKKIFETLGDKIPK